MKNKRRIMTLVGIIISSITIILLINTFQAKGNTISSNYKTVTVQKGDTLWNVVKNNCKDYKDIRKVIYDIRKLNNMTSASIWPGQKIKIPADISK